jgi:threonine dehydratase
LIPSPWLSSLTGAEVFLKCEGLQVTGSFKVRGAIAALSRLDDAVRRRGVVASSAGNHGLGLARAASVFGIPATVVIPRRAPEVKAAGIEALGARVVRSPHDGYDRTQAWTLAHLDDLGGAFVSPFEDRAVIAGNGGTTALEIFEEVSDLDALVIPCGGGGCSMGAGIAAGARSPGTRIIAVNTDASPGMWMSRRDGRPHLEVESRPTIAEGIEGGVGALSFPLAERTIDEVVMVSEATIRRAVVEVLLHERLLVEGSGAAGVAALLEGKAEGKRLGVVLTGSNIDGGRLQELLEEYGAEGLGMRDEG